MVRSRPPRFGLSPLLALAATPAFAAASAIAPAFGAGPVSVTDGWIRMITPQTPAGAYARLSNSSSDPVTLVGASSPDCSMMMLHKSEQNGGTDRMVHVPAIVIEPGKRFAFSPGGYHLMCLQPRMTPGEQIPVTLELKGGQTVTAPFTVYGATGKPAHQ